MLTGDGNVLFSLLVDAEKYRKQEIEKRRPK
jgi:hypothetical protein